MSNEQDKALVREVIGNVNNYAVDLDGITKRAAADGEKGEDDG